MPVVLNPYDPTSGNQVPTLNMTPTSQQAPPSLLNLGPNFAPNTGTQSPYNSVPGGPGALVFGGQLTPQQYNLLYASPSAPGGSQLVPGQLPPGDPYGGSGNRAPATISSGGLFTGTGSGALNAAQYTLGTEAMRREQLLNEAEMLQRTALVDQLGSPALAGLRGTGYDILNRPFIASDPALQRSQETAVRNRIASAGQSARASLSDQQAARGVAGGESASSAAGVRFNQAMTLADQLNSIQNDFAQRQTQERAMNAQTLAGIGAAEQGLSLDPVNMFASGLAGRVNPELQAQAQLQAQIGGMRVAGGYGQPSNAQQLSPIMGAGIGAAGTIAAAALLAASSKRFKEKLKPTKTTGKEALQHIRKAASTLQDWNYKDDPDVIENALVIEDAPRYGFRNTLLNVPTAIGDLMAAVDELDRKVSKRGRTR